MLQTIIIDQDRVIYSLPVKHGGLGITISSGISEIHYEHPQSISASLASVINMQGSQIPDSKIRNKIKYSKKKESHVLLKEKVLTVKQKIDAQIKKAIDDGSEPGASSWLSAIPLEQYGVFLNKAEFRDAIMLRYGKELKGLPGACPCGQKYHTTHALNCKKGGFVMIRHNSIRDYEGNLLSKVHTDVETVPSLQPVEGEIVNGIPGDNARSDVRARGVWRDSQKVFFDVRITNTNSASQHNVKTEKVLLRHEKEKKRQYNRRIMNIEHGIFTPLLFSVSGVLSKECSMFHKHMAEKIAKKFNESYEKVITVIRYKLSFIILRSALLCIRGSRYNRVLKDVDEFSLAFDSAGL